MWTTNLLDMFIVVTISWMFKFLVWQEAIASRVPDSEQLKWKSINLFIKQDDIIKAWLGSNISHTKPNCLWSIGSLSHLISVLLQQLYVKARDIPRGQRPIEGIDPPHIFIVTKPSTVFETSFRCFLRMSALKTLYYLLWCFDISQGCKYFGVYGPIFKIKVSQKPLWKGFFSD